MICLYVFKGSQPVIHAEYGVWGVFYDSTLSKNRGFFGVEGPPYGVSNLH